MKNSDVLISVVMPVYNGEKVIKRAIDSVLKQTHSNLELIVVDDASTDKSVEVVEGIKDRRLRLIRHERNRNGSAARNTGLKASKGEYLALVDDDDEWLPTRLEVLLSELQKRDEDVYKAIFCDYYYDNGNSRKLVRKIESNQTIENILLLKESTAGSSLLFHKSMLDTVGYFDETYERHQDLEFTIRYLRHYKLAIVSEPLTIIHGHSGRLPGFSGNTSSKATTLPADRIAKVKDKFLSDFNPDIEKLSKKVQKQIYARNWLQVARLYSISGDVGKTLHYLARSLSYTLVFSNRIKFLPFETYFVMWYYLVRGILRKLLRK